MDDLRWILSGVAVVIVAAVYFFSRARKKDQYFSPHDVEKDMPSFSADNNLNNDWKDNVGTVPLVADTELENIVPLVTTENIDEPGIEKNAEVVQEDVVKKDESRQDEPVENQPGENQLGEDQSTENQPGENKPAKNESSENSAEDDNDVAIDDIISVYVLAPQHEAIKGEQILSASYALNLEHGDMKIFHRYSETANREIQFSLANIQEPGWFEVNEMHQMETPGISFFMQVNLVENPSHVLDDMLICAHSMSTMLGAVLCSAQRKPLDEAYTSDLRDKVKKLTEIKKKPV